MPEAQRGVGVSDWVGDILIGDGFSVDGREIFCEKPKVLWRMVLKNFMGNGGRA